VSNEDLELALIAELAEAVPAELADDIQAGSVIDGEQHWLQVGVENGQLGLYVGGHNPFWVDLANPAAIDRAKAWLASIDWDKAKKLQKVRQRCLDTENALTALQNHGLLGYECATCGGCCDVRQATCWRCECDWDADHPTRVQQEIEHVLEQESP
jgi:hypothetical protein